MVDIADCALIDTTARLKRNLDSIQDAISASNFKYHRYNDGHHERTVNVFLAAFPTTVEVDAFLRVLTPYLELFRTSTTHSHNDIYSTRADELADFSTRMNPSAVETARSLLEWISYQVRFARPGWCVGEYRRNEWAAPFSSSPAASRIALELLENAETGQLLGAGKCTLVKRDDQWILAIPFYRLRDDLSFERDKHSSALFHASVTRNSKARRLHGGECAAVLLFDTPPHANVLHTIVQYRQYYFESYLPALIHHAKQIIYDRATALHSVSRLPNAEMSDLWQSLGALCSDMLPLLFQALDATGDLSIYRVEQFALQPLFSWEPRSATDGTHILQARSISLRGGERGLVATTFLDSRRISAVCNDIPSAIQNAGAGNTKFAYVAWRGETQSEYCRKIYFKSTPIGVLNVESKRLNAFTGRVIAQIDSFADAVEHYIREHLSATDSLWLSITAGSYHNLHELRQSADKWAAGPYKTSVQEAITAFDRAEDKGDAYLDELGDFLLKTLDDRVLQTPAATQKSFRRDANARCKFTVNRSTSLSRVRVELLKRIGKNLLTNLQISSDEEDRASFRVMDATRPYEGVRYLQEHSTAFPEKWLPQIGFAPLAGQTKQDRMHHGLFLCGAIARSLGGFLWAGNVIDPVLGLRSARSVVEVTVPLVED